MVNSGGNYKETEKDMNSNLQDILYSDERPGLIDPIELQQSDVQGIEIIPLCLLGIFNPMGPTLVALNLIIKDDAPSGAILYSSLNPFAQTRLLTARTPSDPAGLFELFENLYRVGNENILGGLPDFVFPSMDNEDFADAVVSMLFGLVSSTPLRDPLSKTNRDYRNHWRDAWSRIPSMEEMMRQARSGKNQEAVIGEPDPDDFDEWVSIVTDMEHITGELGAIIQAWGGSIQMAGGLPHMPLEEVANELDALGFPYLQGVL